MPAIYVPDTDITDVHECIQRHGKENVIFRQGLLNGFQHDITETREGTCFHKVDTAEEAMKESGVEVYDEGEGYADRFTVILPSAPNPDFGHVYSMSRDANMPNGVCMYDGRFHNYKIKYDFDKEEKKQVPPEEIPSGTAKQIATLMDREARGLD